MKRSEISCSHTVVQFMCIQNTICTSTCSNYNSIGGHILHNMILCSYKALLLNNKTCSLQLLSHGKNDGRFFQIYITLAHPAENNIYSSPLTPEGSILVFTSYALHFVHQLLTNCVCLLFILLGRYCSVQWAANKVLKSSEREPNQ